MNDVARSLALFVLAAFAEIGGAWLVWQGVREHRGAAWIGAGIVALAAYGFVATLQDDAHFVEESRIPCASNLHHSTSCREPVDATARRDSSTNFGRVLAAYGGIFVAGSLAWGVVADGFRPDRFDIIGAVICLVGVGVIMWAPR